MPPVTCSWKQAHNLAFAQVFPPQLQLLYNWWEEEGRLGSKRVFKTVTCSFANISQGDIFSKTALIQVASSRARPPDNGPWVEIMLYSKQENLPRASKFSFHQVIFFCRVLASVTWWEKARCASRQTQRDAGSWFHPKESLFGEREEQSFFFGEWAWRVAGCQVGPGTREERSHIVCFP